MIWHLIIKDPANQPPGNDYTLWKEQIAKECFFHCVYCAISENAWGGIDNYHIDHFRPKSIPAYKHLEFKIGNLFLACPVCNRFKSNDWPAEPLIDYSNAAYPDPSIISYDTIFQVSQHDFTVKGVNCSAQYVVERLYLNRPQLVYERREHALQNKFNLLKKETIALANQLDDKQVFKKAMSVLDNILVLLDRRKEIRPYKLAEIRRQKAKSN